MRIAEGDHTRLGGGASCGFSMQQQRFHTNTPAARRRASCSAACKHRARPRLLLWIKAALALFILAMG